MIKYCVNMEDFLKSLTEEILKWKNKENAGLEDNSDFLTERTKGPRFRFTKIYEEISSGKYDWVTKTTIDRVDVINHYHIPDSEIKLPSAWAPTATRVRYKISHNKPIDISHYGRFCIGVHWHFPQMRNIASDARIKFKGRFEDIDIPVNDFNSGGFFNENKFLIGFEEFSVDFGRFTRQKKGQTIHKYVADEIEMTFYSIAPMTVSALYNLYVESVFPNKDPIVDYLSYPEGSYDVSPKEYEGYKCVDKPAIVKFPESEHSKITFHYEKKEPGKIEKRCWKNHKELFKRENIDDLFLGEHRVNANVFEPPNLILTSVSEKRITLTEDEPHAIVDFYYESR